jgi:hypothetical protein
MVGFTAWDAVRRVSARASALFILGVLLTGACAGKSSGDDAQSDPCPDLCAKGMKCPGAPAIQGSCDDFCLGQDYVAENTGCHDLYLKSTACTAKLSDVCTAQTDCRTEILAAYTCEHNYCAAHPSSDACVNVM